MTSAHFLDDLRKRLRKLPSQEREQALLYYEEIFAEAGPGGEAALVERLGGPAQVANTIIGEYAIKDLQGQSSQGEKRSGLKTMWLVILAAMASPIAIPLAIAVVALVFALLVTIAAVYFALFASALALVAGGIGCIIKTFIVFFTQPAEMVLLLGGGLVSLALGTALFLGMVKLGQLTVRGITKAFAHTLRKRGGAYA